MAFEKNWTERNTFFSNSLNLFSKAKSACSLTGWH